MMKYVLVLVLLAAATVTADDTTADDTAADVAGNEGTDESEGTCEIDGVTYQYNDELPSDNPCAICTCRGQPTPSCFSIYCDWPDCPEGYEIFYPEDECCPGCQPIP
ncbi:protein NEL-like [Physella acuta]|uniref:protein NEL-like n=1 Tax=Physella acuta TaxID=109671 RepID=UPI0027DCFD02|nr:protein NEL-like [Physella acuta]XP_059179485.1 protein NEL-like [Physella acuta]